MQKNSPYFFQLHPHPPTPHPALLLVVTLQVTLSIQGGGEGHVVEGAGGSIGPCVGRHAGDAVLRLVWRELPPEFLSCDVVLTDKRREGFMSLFTVTLNGLFLLWEFPSILRTLTLSPARILNEAMTWSAVSVSVVSVDMKSMKAWKVTAPLALGSTMPMMRANSASPWQKEKPKQNRLTQKRRVQSDIKTDTDRC